MKRGLAWVRHQPHIECPMLPANGQLARSRSSSCGSWPTWARYCAAVICVIGLSACASPGPATVSVPVVVPCVPADTPNQPAVTEASVLANLSDYELVLRIAAERLELIAWSRKITPILAACR